MTECNYAQRIADNLIPSTPVFNARGDAFYGSCIGNGLHLCGSVLDPKGVIPNEQAWTASSIKLSKKVARECFVAAKEVGECCKDSQDYVLDLIIDDNTVDGFYTNRQLLPLIQKEVKAVLEKQDE